MSNKQTQDAQRVELLTQLFHGPFNTMGQFTDEQLRTVIPSFFVNWLCTHYHSLDKNYEAAQAGVPEETWEWFEQIVNGAVPMETLQHIWPAITLARRPKPKHEIIEATLLVMLRFADGTIFPMSRVGVPEIMSNDGITRDHDLAYFYNSQFAAVLEDFRQMTVDMMHDAGDNFGDDKDYNAFMGVLINVLPPQIHESYRPMLEKFIRLFQSLLRPPKSPFVLQAIARRRAELAAKQTGKVVGGFNCG